jgi:hypothetical protein
MAKAPIRRTRGGAIAIDLPVPVRDAVRDVASRYHELLTSPGADDDPAVARLFPTAYPDDPLRNIGFDETTASSLRDERLEALATVIATADADRLSAEEADAWMRTLNDVRIVLGTRLAVTEESKPQDFDGGGAQTFELYGLLSAIVDLLVTALSP